jgi:hypothetical protein
MEQLLAEREPSYRRADLVFDTSELTPGEVARRIDEAMRGFWPREG